MATAPQARGELFFRVMAVSILVLAVAGFGSVAIRFPDSVPTFYPMLVVHSVAMAGWLILFVVQTQLVANGRRGLHMKLGAFSIMLAALVIFTGLSVTYGTYRPGLNEPIMVANTGIAINFSLCYLLALRYRSQSMTHKRLMLLAAIALMPTALSRLAISMELGGIFGALFFLAMLTSIPFRDWLVMRNSPATVRNSPELRHAVRVGRLGAIGQVIVFGIVLVVQIGMSRIFSQLHG